MNRKPEYNIYRAYILPSGKLELEKAPRSTTYTEDQARQVVTHYTNHMRRSDVGHVTYIYQRIIPVLSYRGARKEASAA
jgi:hypothetical protein